MPYLPLTMLKIYLSFRETTPSMHRTLFLKACEDEGNEHEDATMKMFVATLEGACAWYKSLPNNSIQGLNPFFEKFLERWGDKQDISFILRNFTNINKKENETVLEFNTRFAKAYHRIPTALIPNTDYALFSYLEKFDEILTHCIEILNFPIVLGNLN